ncbi:hypothetical protein D9619_009097 [Psilocybe cf. subviscida]|uniref:Ricin B lectin domain-containing protein n=1 Tax=Psilocybe cf. subviscida TaxID=2480587 RepID=A0A8H5BWR0_9AGAR|nr:hypothetical protein D9619_009097 [Psilocybe cf. subviscida]
MSSDEQTEREEAQFSQDFRSASVRSGDGAGGGRGGDIGSHNNVNSNNTVTHHTTIHIHSEEQLVRPRFPYVHQNLKLNQVGQLAISRLPSHAPTSLSGLGSGSRLDLNSRSHSPALNSLYASRPHFIFNAEGRALDLSNNDQNTVLAWPFHGGQNQQWFLNDDGQGRMAFMCMKNRKYLALKRLEENAALFLSITPFYWEISTHGDKYRVEIPKLPQGLPQTNLALSIGSSVASLRPNYETHNTLLYILADTPEYRAKIQTLEVVSRNGLFISTTPENVVHKEDDAAFIDLYERSLFIFDGQGRILDLSGNDHQTVLPWGFHGHWNQQVASIYLKMQG